MKKIFIILSFSLLLFSCSKGDIYTGSPVDNTNVTFETLLGTISTTETNVVAGQTIPVTITIPQSFAMDVKVQVTALLANTNVKRTRSIVIPAGQTTVTDKMGMPGADLSDLPFNMPVQMYLTAITTGDFVVPTGFPGKQYTMTSNTVTLDYGDSSLAATNIDRCGIRFSYQYPNNGAVDYNNFKIILKDETNAVYTIPTGATLPINGYNTYNASVGGSSLNFLSAAVDHTYTISAYPIKLMTSPIDVPYRFTVRFPDSSTKVFAGVMSGLTSANVGNAASAINLLKVVKSGSTYTPSQP